MKALNYFLREDSNLTEEFFTHFINRLIEKDKKILEGNTKLYINSLVHRERFRIWQTILTLLPKINKKNYAKLFEYADQILVIETQPSIRIIVEWVVIRIVISQLDSFDFRTLFGKIENVIFFWNSKEFK